MRSVGNDSLLYSVLLSQWRYSLVTNYLTVTIKLAKDLYALATKESDPALLLGAYRALATSLYFRGQFEHTRKYTAQAIDIWKPERASSVEEYYAPIVTCLAIDALSLWQL